MTEQELKENAEYLLVETGTSMPFTIDLRLKEVLDYPGGAGGFSMYEKVVDSGKYTLLNSDFETLAIYEGYIPNILPNDYGDYLTLNVDARGIIINLPEELTFKEFIYG